jgi:hypothetical protein
MSRDDLLALSERCEKAQRPDRELDAAIWLVLDPEAYSVTAAGIFSESGNWVGTLPTYTASLDAAMTLKPEGWQWSRYSTDDVFYLMSSLGTVQGHGANDALALCAAALRARALMVEART